MIKILRTICWLAPAVLFAACTTVAPPYFPSVDNVQTLKTATGGRARTGTFESRLNAKNRYPVPLRADSMRSPVGDSFGAYLADAMTKELAMASKLSTQGDVEVKATLLENEISVGISTGEASLSARFVVSRAGVVRYDEVKSTSAQWDSSFAAVIAVPRARDEYPHAVQKLLGELYADPAFLNAIQ